MNAISPNVFIREGAVFANSRDVAAYFEKRHDHVLRDVDNILKTNKTQNWGAEISALFVERSEPRPVDNPGRPFRSFDMTRDGFTLLAMGFTGAKALGFKLRYIEAFNQMEAALKSAAVLPPEPADDLPLGDRRLWVDAIALCLRVHGRAAARRMWARSPLPQVGLVEPEPLQEGAALDPHGCLVHLLEWRIQPGMPAVADELVSPASVSGTKGFLRRHGILPNPKGFDDWVAVSTTHRALARHYRATPWRDAWAEALLQIPGARRAPTCLHFDHTTRAVLIPLSVVRDGIGEADRVPRAN